MSDKDDRQLNKTALTTPSAEELLSFMVSNGTIDMNDVTKAMQQAERKEILNAHPYSISHGKDGRWRTWVKEETVKGGRRKIAKSSREKLEDALYEHYLAHDDTKKIMRMTIRELFPRWIEFKSLHTSADTYISRIQSDWKKYYENDPIVDRPIRELRKLELDEWAHGLIKKYNMSKNMYYNVSVIMRQCLYYAVDLEIIPASPFEKVRVDGRRLFRKVRKKKDETQVYRKEEIVKLFKLAWNDYHNSKRLVYRLSPLALMFQFYTGLRIGELCAVKHDDIRNGMLHISRMLRRDTKEIVEHTKTHEDRELILPDEAIELVRIARDYQKENDIDSEFIFSTTEDPLPYAQVNVLLKKYCKKAGILYRSSHKIRKTYISELIDGGININTIRSYVGHADERTTYFGYCYDQAPDPEKKRRLEQALTG